MQAHTEHHAAVDEVLRVEAGLQRLEALEPGRAEAVDGERGLPAPEHVRLAAEALHRQIEQRRRKDEVEVERGGAMVGEIAGDHQGLGL